MLDLFDLLVGRLVLFCLPARLAYLILGLLVDCAWVDKHGSLLDLRRLRLPGSLAMLASLVYTILGLLGLRRRHLARSLVELAKSRFCVNFRKIVRNTTRRFTFSMIFRKSSYLRGF